MPVYHQTSRLIHQTNVNLRSCVKRIKCQFIPPNKQRVAQVGKQFILFSAPQCSVLLLRIKAAKKGHSGEKMHSDIIVFLIAIFLGTCSYSPSWGKGRKEPLTHGRGGRVRICMKTFKPTIFFQKY